MVSMRQCACGHLNDMVLLTCEACPRPLLNRPVVEHGTSVPPPQSPPPQARRSERQPASSAAEPSAAGQAEQRPTRVTAIELQFTWGVERVGRGCGLGRLPDFCRFADKVAEADPERYVSRQHALVRLRDGAIHIIDQGSKHGTRIGDVTLPKGGSGIAEHGAKITLADVLTFEVRGI